MNVTAAGPMIVSEPDPKQPQVAPPAATGNAGPQFEGKVGAFYLLSLLSSAEPRGLPGATIRTIAFQQRGSGRPLDDVVVSATNADGSEAILEIQAKRALTFTASDKEFTDVVAQMWAAAQKPEFKTTRYELAVAIARTTTRVEHDCQQVLHWARQLPDGGTFSTHMRREKFSSRGMRDFVDVFRANLGAAGAPTDDETIWLLLSRFQILVFDFESLGSDYEHRARERARLALTQDQANRAADLWPVLIDQAGACARAAGALSRPAAVTLLETHHGFRFDQRADLRLVQDRLSEAADQALDEIKDDVGGVRLARAELIDQADAGLEQQRTLYIAGAPGVGKSWVMKHLARRLQTEGRIIVLRNGRIIPGGWVRMAHEIGCPVSRDELFNELGCGGGATLFIDNIDQIDEAGSWATVSDLLTGVARNAGWRAVVTCGVGNDEWKTKLPAELRNAGIGPLRVEEITDEETAVFSEGNPALAIILSDTHPARGIARNLFYLSRMIELGVGEEQAAAIATEMDLARLWWRYGGGRREDDSRFARLKVLRAMAAQIIAFPSQVTFKADDHSSATIAELLRFDSFREEIKGATVAFRHDVLRDWAVGFFLHEDEQILPSLPMDQPLSPGLARGLEIAARLAIESDPSGARWSPLLAVVERDGGHGSWKRPVLLALPRAEQALALFRNLKPVLLEDDGRRLSEIIRLLIAVDSESFAKVIARVQPSITIPSGARDFILPRGLGWTWLVLWLAAEAKTLPTALIPDVSNVFQAWLIATQNQSLPINAAIVGILLEWLTLLEHAMMPRAYHDIEDAPPDLKIPHLNDVRDEIRITAFAFARLNPIAAERYLSALDPDTARHHDMEAILRAPATLPKAAPAAFVNFALSTLIEKEDPDDCYRTRHRFGPFDIHEHLFLPASPGQGPFFELLENAPVEGLRLIHGLVEHATQWRRNHYIEAGQPFPRISIPFPGGTKSFEGDWSVYQWARSRTPSMIVASALMALEAWGHCQVEAGRAFQEVLHEVLGPDGSSLAFVSVAVDLALSHWPEARDTAWPMVATPELLEFDDARLNIDLTGVDRLLTLEQEPSAWPVKRADLDARSSRRNRLSDKIGYYVFHAKPELFEALRAALEEARDQIRQRPDYGEDPIRGLHATAERAVRMTYAEHWPFVKVTLANGSEAEVRQFQRDPEEQRRFDAEARRVDADMRHHNVRAKIQLALFDRAKSTPEIVAEGIEWAKVQPAASAEPEPAEDDDQEKFNKEWDQRAVIMAAALAARDYEAPDRDDVLAWVRPVLQAAITEEGTEYSGNDQIQYNATAIAALGLVVLYLKEQDITTRNTLLRLSSHRHPAVLKVLGSHFTDFARLDPQLPRSLIRIAIAGAIRPRRVHNDHHNRTNQLAYREKIAAAIVVEQQWLDGTIKDEPAWPQLPTWLSRPRRGIRLGNWGIEEDDEPNEEPPPDHYVDERVLGPLVGHLIPLTVGELPPWVVDLAVHLMRWTDKANGPHGENDRERDNRPSTWNAHFFDFLGILSVALPHDAMVAMFLEPIIRFKDEAFHDVMATFLRGFDRAMQAPDTKRPENPVAVRALLADRIRRSWNFKRIGREKGFTSEVHAGDALNAMFYQPPRFANNGRPSIPDNWVGLDQTLPVLIELVTGAPSSGYLAGLFQNLVEPSPRAALLPFVVRAATAWCSAYGVDTNFWSEKNIGSRLCAWLERALADRVCVSVVPAAAQELGKCLDILIRSGIAQAREIEEQIAARFDITLGNS